jgi:tetratricopeptide (TPR) repeat protein
MTNKLLLISLALFFSFLTFIYFLGNPSYEKSLQAKYYYEMGDYKEALVLAKEAFSLDVYNRMASTVMAQSITSMKYASYVEDAKTYMNQINDIANHEIISDADKAKIRIICQIMISGYIKLAPSVITDNDLVEDAAKYHNGFEKLLEKVNR